jgi:acyl-CoA oxidase
VAGIETTATLDLVTDEFVIHSPTVTSTKYWPGGLGLWANHAVVFARCIVDGNEFGV